MNTKDSFRYTKYGNLRYMNTNNGQFSVPELTLRCSIKLFTISNVSRHCAPTYSTQKWTCLLALSAWKANSRSSSNETVEVLSNRQAHYRVPNSLPLDSTLSRQPIPVHILAVYYPSIYVCFFQNVSQSQNLKLSFFLFPIFPRLSHRQPIVVNDSKLYTNIQPEDRITKFLTL